MKSHVAILASRVLTVVGTFVTGCGTNTSQIKVTKNTTSSQDTISNSTSSSADTSAKKGTINIGYVNWTEDVADVNLWKQLLEQRGYKVNLKLLNAGPLWQGLAQGSIDFHFDVWLPTTDQTYMNRYGSKLENLGKWYQGKTKLGFVVPKYVKIHSIAQLNAHASEFNNEIVGIDPGAGETQIIQKTVIPDYGLKLKLVNSSSSTSGSKTLEVNDVA